MCAQANTDSARFLSSLPAGQDQGGRFSALNNDAAGTVVLMPYSTTISQAEGMLASRFAVSIERAAEILAAQAAENGVPITELAYQVVHDGLHFTQP
jgi:hypothetical protein